MPSYTRTRNLWFAIIIGKTFRKAEKERVQCKEEEEGKIKELEEVKHRSPLNWSWEADVGSKR